MIITKIENINIAEKLLKSTFYLASSLDKKFGAVTFSPEIEKEELISLFNKLNVSPENIFILSEKEISLTEFCEREEVSFLLIQLLGNSRKTVQKELNKCRELRIPYLFFKNEFSVLRLKRALVPVGFLMEEYEKAQFASAFGRFCDTQITLLQANDYGSKAATTVGKMKDLFDKFSLKYQVEKGNEDSFKIDNEAMLKSQQEGFDILIVSASREYGLDDVIFGPKELHLVRKSTVPLLIVNPRDDLYTLCD
ncbi:MAG: hypothetical protein QM751_10250 [Paludibacteraceae bacterium]